MKPIDVQNTEYLCFDAMGDRVEPRVIGSGRSKGITFDANGEPLSEAALAGIDKFVRRLPCSSESTGRSLLR